MFDNKNEYTSRIERIGGLRHYVLCFKDGQGLLHEVEVPRAVYLEFLRFAREEHNQSRWNRRYIEQSDLTDQSLYDRARHKPKSVDDTVLDRLRDEQLAEAIAKLPETQKRRFTLYHEFELTYTQIAEAEGCSKVAVKYSVDRAEEKIRRIFINQT